MGSSPPRVLIVVALAAEGAPFRRLGLSRPVAFPPTPAAAAGAASLDLAPLVPPAAFRTIRAWRGPFGGCAATLIIAGMGPQAARATMTHALGNAPDEPPDLVLSVGVAGALDRVTALSTVYLGDPLLAPDAPPLRADPALAPAAGLPSASCLTVPDLASTPAVKAALRAAHGAALVEMESYWVARACQDHGLPWLALRAAVDGPDLDLTGLVSPDAPLLAQAAFAARHPRLAWQLARETRRATARLARAAERICATLSPPGAPSPLLYNRS